MSPFSKVAQITVAGQQNLTASQVTQATTIKQGDFIWRWYYQRDQISSIARRHNRQIDRVKLELTGPVVKNCGEGISDCWPSPTTSR